ASPVAPQLFWFPSVPRRVNPESHKSPEKDTRGSTYNPGRVQPPDPRRRRARRPPRPPRPLGGGDRAVHHPARRHPGARRPGGRPRHRRRAADVASHPAGQRAAGRRAGAVPRPGRRAGDGAGGGGRALPCSPHPRAGAMTGTTGLTGRSAGELAAMVRTGDVSAVEVTDAHLDRIEALDGEVRSFLCVGAETARAAAAAVDAARARGEALGPLAGVPLAVKDMFCTVDLPTTCASRILDGWRPPYDSTVVARLRAAGAVVIGKTNLDEFAMGSST